MDTPAPDRATERRPFLVFDGDCAFCQAAIQQIRARARPRMIAESWQSLPESLIRPHLQRLDREVLLLDGETVICGGSVALARFLGSSRAPHYRALALFVRLPVVSLLARQIYRWVAMNRHRMPAGTAACAVPRAPH